jgi:hypothetical protein
VAAPDTDLTELEPPCAGLEALVPAPEPVVPAPPPPPRVAGSPVEPVVSVGSVGGVVLVELLVGGSVVGGVLVVGGSVVGGAVLVGGLRCRSLVAGGGLPVEVVARLVRGTIAVLRGRVVVGAVEEAGEIAWPRGNVVVVVVCEVASAACRGEVAKPTMLPPIAPISIATTTLTHRRVATNATGLKRGTPPVRASCIR